MMAENSCSRAKVGKGKCYSQVSLLNVLAFSPGGRKDGDEQNQSWG